MGIIGPERATVLIDDIQFFHRHLDVLSCPRLIRAVPKQEHVLACILHRRQRVWQPPVDEPREMRLHLIEKFRAVKKMVIGPVGDGLDHDLRSIGQAGRNDPRGRRSQNDERYEPYDNKADADARSFHVTRRLAWPKFKPKSRTHSLIQFQRPWSLELRIACHFQTPYLSPTCHFKTCISINVFRPPVTLSPPVTPWGSPLLAPTPPLNRNPDPTRTNPRLSEVSRRALNYEQDQDHKEKLRHCYRASIYAAWLLEKSGLNGRSY